MLDYMSLLQLRDVKTDVAYAVKEQAAYLKDKLTKYEERDYYRVKRNRRVLAMCGPGRAGKDLGAAWLGANTSIVYSGSLSSVVCPLIASALQIPVTTCFENRHEDRDYWFRFCNELRKDDPTLLAKLLLADADIVVGIRGLVELDACIANGVVDLAIWVQNSRVPVDPTLEYGQDKCHIIVENNTDKLDYFHRLEALSKVLSL